MGNPMLASPTGSTGFPEHCPAINATMADGSTPPSIGNNRPHEDAKEAERTVKAILRIVI
jgi:hypothetical protein